MKNRWFGLGVVVLMLLASAALYSRLPELVPTHWNVRGEVDRWMGRFPGAFLMPLVGLGIWALLNALPTIDPRRANYSRFIDTYWLVVSVVLLFLAVVHVAVLAIALGVPLRMERVVLPAVGLFFVVIGNYLPRVKPNWWMGIRTPWTLDNEQVWQRTHRLGGWCFVVGGVLLIASALLPGAVQAWVIVPVALVMGVIPTLYSYLLWRRETRGRGA